jgi:hypothetical protein
LLVAVAVETLLGLLNLVEQNQAAADSKKEIVRLSFKK